MKPELIVYFASTHWDREWYKTVDEFRYMLIPVVDRIITTLEQNSDYPLFHFDGQTSMINDYLIIRPEQRKRITALIKSGKIAVGPWFTMPDEFLTSSESLIQNLLMGHAIAEEFGGSSLKAGYVCDTFGHIANLPQILNGFGIDNALISRGTNDSELECFFRWISPDGSSVFTFKAPEVCGYGSFYYEVLDEFNPDYEKHMEEITEKAIKYTERELTRTSLPYVLLIDGMDHETIHGFMPQILKRLSEHFGCPVLQSKLDLLPKQFTGAIPEVHGELTSHCKDNIMHNKLIPHTLSSRYDLKSANDRCQNSLEHFAMPCAAIDEINGQDYVYSYITYAYSLLLQNHAHDSICGCSIAAVHREMLTRFEKTQRTAEEYFRQFCRKEYLSSADDSGSCQVKIFNPLPYEYSGLLEFDIDFTEDFETSSLPFIKYEQRNTFLIFDEQGNELPYNIIDASRGKWIKSFTGNKRAADTHRVAVLSTLRPMAFTSFHIQPFDRPYRIMDRISTGPASCSNALIDFSINADGMITIKDKETGCIYEGLHSFLDCCEMGDGWFHIRPIQDQVISSLGCPITIEKTFDGYAACKFLVRYELRLPLTKKSEFGFTKRSEHYQTCMIGSEFTISRTSKLITVKTKIDNSIADHRLQLHLPTGVDCDTYSVNQCNLIVKRKTGFDYSHSTWKEADISEYPMESFVMVRDASHGLLFISKGGLHEVSCPGDHANSMDITLLRCFSKTTGTNGEADGQLTGIQNFEYALYPLCNESDAEITRLKDQYATGYQELTIPHASKQSKPSVSAFTMEGESIAYLTSLPSKHGGILIRATNYSSKNETCKLTFAKPVKTAALCNFLEEVLEEAVPCGNSITIQAKPFQIVTIRVTF